MGHITSSPSLSEAPQLTPLTCSEFKKRVKANYVAKEKAEKNAKKAELAAAQQAEKASKGDGDEAGALEDDSNEEVDPSLYFENRVKAIQAKKAKGINPYPHKFHVSIAVPEFVKKYTSLEAGQQLTDVTVSLAGRIYSKRASGSKLLFYDLKAEGDKVQVMADARNSELGLPG